MWGVTVAGLCVLWFACPAGAIPLESWDDKIPNASNRFKVLTEFGGAAVLDKETGLVWEQSPAQTADSWELARRVCITKKVGGRKSWRLPSVPELASLIDPNQVNPALPLGHPFSNILTVFPGNPTYRTATTNAEDTTLAWIVNFGNGDVYNTEKIPPLPTIAWCVRGGMNADAY